MPSLSSIFNRVSGGAQSVSSGDVQKSLMKAGGFGMFSLTGSMLKKGLEKGLTQADANKDGRVTVDEFTTAVRSAVGGKSLPSWDQFASAGASSLSRDELAGVITDLAKQKSSMGGMADSQGIAKMIISLTDDDGDGKLSKAEFDSLAADLK